MTGWPLKHISYTAVKSGNLERQRENALEDEDKINIISLLGDSDKHAAFRVFMLKLFIKL